MQCTISIILVDIKVSCFAMAQLDISFFQIQQTLSIAFEMHYKT